jgi:hypothetical protein
MVGLLLIVEWLDMSASYLLHVTGGASSAGAALCAMRMPAHPVERAAWPGTPYFACALLSAPPHSYASVPAQSSNLVVLGDAPR